MRRDRANDVARGPAVAVVALLGLTRLEDDPCRRTRPLRGDRPGFEGDDPAQRCQQAESHACARQSISHQQVHSNQRMF